ncbi:MAG: hypothetical protein Q9M20_07520 [Mariprofundaceae bacterium]|nr:hypothetical protein [Mariprofundaceae bacterium]
MPLTLGANALAYPNECRRASFMNALIRFYFALTPRLQAFIILRDGLQCLEYARQADHPYHWLQAASDVQTSLLGGHGRKLVIPELIALLKSIREHLHELAEKHPDFSDKITSACDTIIQYEDDIRQCILPALNFLSEDGLIKAWGNANQKQDFLAHKLNFPQVLPIFWQSLKLQETLAESLQELHSIVMHIDHMLNDFVQWESKTAEEGHAQITPSRDQTYGLLIIGLDTKWVERGIVPDFSGNRLAIRMRFQAWKVGEAQSTVHDDIPYQIMLVPIV